MKDNTQLTFFTICSKNFLAYARTLFDSVRKHHPGAVFYVALCDRMDGMVDRAHEPFEIIELDQLDIPNLPGMIERYNITELNTSIKPYVFDYLFSKRNEQRVVYLDPDILVVSPLKELQECMAAGADAVLTPHVLNPAENVEIDDIKMLQLGIYNLGFVAFNRTARVLDIVRWWARRLENQCVIDIPNGLFVDQKWADLLPSFIAKTHILHHPGYNVAYWNLPQRKVVNSPRGWLVNGLPVRFVHFSGNNLKDENVFSRHSPQMTAANVGEINELLKEYRARVFGNGHQAYSQLPYAFSWNGASGVNEHTPEPERVAQEVVPAASVPVSSSPATPAAGLPPRAPASARPPGRIANTLTTLRRMRDHSGGWWAMAAKGMGVYRRGGMRLVRDTTRQLNIIYPLVHRNGVRRPVQVASYSEPEHEAISAAASGGRGKLLFIDMYTPRPDCDAGSITAFYLMKILVDIGYDVTFIPSDLVKLGHYTQQLENVGVTCLGRDDVSSIEAHLIEDGKQYDYALLCRAPVVEPYIDMIRRHASRAKIILNTSDLHYLRDIRQAEIEGSEEKMQAALRWKERELDVIRRCDYSIVMSDHELEILSKELPNSSIHHVPLMFVDIPGREGDYASRKDLLFIGGFPHQPNVDAVVYFCKQIWPLVHARIPDAKVHLIGNAPTDEVHALATIPGVDVVGYAENLKPWFDGIRMSIAPLRYGAGIKGKLGTSLSFGVPSVATSVAVEGMRVIDEKQVLVADEPQAFADQVVRLYNDEALWNRLSQAGLDFVTDTYSLDAGLKRIDAFMNMVAADPPGFPSTAVRTAEQYDRYFARATTEYFDRWTWENALIPQQADSFLFDGYCAVCDRPSTFDVNFMYACGTHSETGRPMPNWREQLVCAKCGLVNRTRAAIHAFRSELKPASDARIYITEQTTPLYHWMHSQYPNTQGSEYLADRVSAGQELGGLRNEDIMALSWPDASFDFVLSFDVLEHVSDPAKAFAECFRILRPGGSMLWAAQFAFDDKLRMADKNLVRASLDEAGTVTHLLEPIYHRDPVDPDGGSLCFRYFGQEAMAQMREAGFDDVRLQFYWSANFAYLGLEQVLCIATKATR